MVLSLSEEYPLMDFLLRNRKEINIKGKEKT
jgi:hypothetical protein